MLEKTAATGVRHHCRADLCQPEYDAHFIRGQMADTPVPAQSTVVTVVRLLFPAEPRRIPHARWWKIAARTVHIAAMGVLLGGHMFGVRADLLWPYLWTAIATGSVLIALEVYPDGHWLHQGCALAIYAKLALLCLIPFFWEARVPILLAVVVVSSVASHAPRRLRHYSVVFKRVMVD
jgi:hypothetical protein